MSESSSSPRDPDPGTSSFDADRLLDLVDGDRSLLREMNELLWEDVPAWLESIEDALRNEDCETLTNSAHALKGALSNFAAGRATDVAADLEEMGRRLELGPVADRSADLRRELDLLSVELGRFVAE